MSADLEKGAAAKPVLLEKLDGGVLWRVVLATPKANVLDSEKTEALASIFLQAGREKSLKAVVLEGEGPNFSFGASVEEHLPDRCAAMLRGFHGLFYRMLDASVPTLAAVRGHCLGGGLELASFCHRLFASPDAKLGQPEIVLGVFAPVASILLTERMGRGGAEDLLLSGRTLSAEEALKSGLVDEIAADPAEAALEYARRHLAPRSASSLRWAVRAARQGFGARFRAELAALEKTYLGELMSTSDAVEGLRAFLDKRPAQWRDE
jgi:cyclohexa-1,5-dienecarbonyl-CoA hydratase